MTRTSRIALFAAASLAAFVSPLFAQSSNLQYQVANLVEDQRLMAEQLRSVLAEMDDLRRENVRLREVVREYESKLNGQAANYATVGQVNELVRKTVDALEARDEVLRKEMVAMVGDELEKFGKSVNDALGNVRTTSGPKPPPVFDTTGIPQNGIPYTVQPGDTLSSIAKQFNSRTDWIKNINKIAEARLLQVGQVIFVPQSTTE